MPPKKPDPKVGSAPRQEGRSTSPRPAAKGGPATRPDAPQSSSLRPTAKSGPPSKPLTAAEKKKQAEAEAAAKATMAEAEAAAKAAEAAAAATATAKAAAEAEAASKAAAEVEAAAKVATEAAAATQAVADAEAAAKAAADALTAEAAVGPEKRIALDGWPYAKEDFLAFYGGTKEWDVALPALPPPSVAGTTGAGAAAAPAPAPYVSVFEDPARRAADEAELQALLARGATLSPAEAERVRALMRANKGPAAARDGRAGHAPSPPRRDKTPPPAVSAEDAAELQALLARSAALLPVEVARARELMRQNKSLGFTWRTTFTLTHAGAGLNAERFTPEMRTQYRADVVKGLGPFNKGQEASGPIPLCSPVLSASLETALSPSSSYNFESRDSAPTPASVAGGSGKTLTPPTIPVGCAFDPLGSWRWWGCGTPTWRSGRPTAVSSSTFGSSRPPRLAPP
jgi:hypothetical protein